MTILRPCHNPDAWTNDQYTLERSMSVDFMWNLYDERTNTLIDKDKSRTVLLTRNKLIIEE